jgi:hypothetical protein
LSKGRSLFEVKVLENKAPLPSQISKAIPKPFAFRGMTVTALSGTIQKSGEDFVFTARGSNRRFALEADEAIKKRLREVASTVVVSGRVVESPAQDGQTPLPTLQVTELREAPSK